MASRKEVLHSLVCRLYLFHIHFYKSHSGLCYSIPSTVQNWEAMHACLTAMCINEGLMKTPVVAVMKIKYLQHSYQCKVPWAQSSTWVHFFLRWIPIKVHDAIFQCEKTVQSCHWESKCRYWKQFIKTSAVLHQGRSVPCTRHTSSQ